MVSFEEASARDYAVIQKSGYTNDYYKKFWHNQEEGFESLYYLNFSMDASELRSKVEQIMRDPAYGNVFRVKGFLKQENAWLQLNGTREDLKLEPIPEGQQVLIIIGEQLEKDRLQQVFGECGEDGHK